MKRPHILLVAAHILLALLIHECATITQPAAPQTVPTVLVPCPCLITATPPPAHHRIYLPEVHYADPA